MNFYISDPHFGHKSSISAFDRPYNTIEEMDRDIIRRWQERVTPEDTVYILGDLIVYARNPLQYLIQLPGRKVLILGNHDTQWIKRSGIDPLDWFDSVHEQLDIQDEGISLRLCHNPLDTELPEDGYLVYGHIHNNTQNPMWREIWREQRALNATVDVALEIDRPFPATFRELLVTNAAFRVFNPACQEHEIWIEYEPEVHNKWNESP